MAIDLIGELKRSLKKFSYAEALEENFKNFQKSLKKVLQLINLDAIMSTSVGRDWQCSLKIK